MSIEFAEKIIDGMVDESGHCGERGLSSKQFEAIVYGCSAMECGESRDAGGWHGDYGHRDFWERDWEGKVGKYNVKLNEYHHFHPRYTVVSIDPRPQEEVEFEAWMRELAKFEHSEWVSEPKRRIDLELVLVRDYSYERPAYTYGYEIAHIYTLANDDGDCFVWKTTGYLDVEWYDDNDDWHCKSAEPGDRVRVRATVKGHDEYRGVKQTVLTRVKVNDVEKRSA